MNKEQTMVKEFHEAFGCVVNETPTVPDFETMCLRLELIREEVEELRAEGFGVYETFFDQMQQGNKPNLVKIADALGDILYVVYGTAVSCGIDMEPIFAEIHRSNMSKLQPDGTVLRREDGKVLKPDTYSPANLEAILAQQGV